METEKILLRYWHESDAEVLFKYASDPDVGPRAGWPAHKSVEESWEIIRTFIVNMVGVGHSSIRPKISAAGSFVNATAHPRNLIRGFSSI